MLKPSKLAFRSLGVVATNKPLTSDEIEVLMIETSPMADGEISDHKEKIKAAAQNSQGAAYSVEVDSSNTVKAKWLPFARGNRLTPPDVRRDARVMIWQFDGVEEYFWTEIDDLSLRKLETVIWAFSATQKESDPFDAKSCYMIEISTHKKLLHIHTSESNKEFCGYDLQINADEGYIQFMDTVGQSFMINSRERQLEMLNNDGSKILIDKRNIYIESPDLIAMKSKKVTIDATDMITTLTNNVLKTSSNKTTADTNELTASTNTITATTSHKGNYSITGLLGVTMKVTMGAGLKVTGGFSMGTGSGEVTGGTLTVDKLISLQPIQAPNVN